MTDGVRGGKLTLLSNDQIKEMYCATLNVLEKVGMLFESDDALTVLKKAGAIVDSKTKVAKLPPYLVEEAVEKAPKSITLCGRDSNYDVKLEGKKVYSGGASGGVYIQDYDGNRRTSTMKDLREITRLEDALNNVHVMPTAAVPQDVPKIGLYTRAYEAMLNNTVKHVFHEAEGTIDLNAQLKMAATVVGSEEELRRRPIISYINCMVSPLKANKRHIEVLMGCAKSSIPVSIETDPQMGGVSPVTIVGTAIQIAAEWLGCNTLAQFTHPGAPVMFAHAGTTMDMRVHSIGPCEGSPERGLLHIATAQLTQHFGIPSTCVAPATDSKTSDIQAGWEKASTFLIPALAGINLIFSGIGMIDSCITVNYEQFIIDNELTEYLFHILKGITIEDRTIEDSLDIIKKVGPLGGHYINQLHTKQYIRKEHWIPELSVRGKWESWAEGGAKSVRELAKEKVKKILAEHQPQPLPQEIQVILKKIIKEELKHMSN